ncbi:MAG TPA: class I SAM-dependent methyltransferase, partial [Gemmatimonadaceae bacterium]
MTPERPLPTDDEIERQVVRLYRRLGWRQSVYVRLRFRLAPLVDTARLVAQGGPVLDLGCGQGMFTHVLRAFDADRQIVGIDTDQRRIHVARTVATDDRLSFRVGDARDFDLANATHVTLIDLLH